MVAIIFCLKPRPVHNLYNYIDLVQRRKKIFYGAWGGGLEVKLFIFMLSEITVYIAGNFRGCKFSQYIK